MAEFQQAGGYEIVTLVDRAATGGAEIIHDGVRVTFPPGVVERPVPQFLAEWLFTVDQQKVHTTDGRFVHRFAIRQPNAELLAKLGPEVGDESPIDIDKTRLEGWDVDRFAPDRGAVRNINLARRPGDYTNDASGASSFGREK